LIDGDKIHLSESEYQDHYDKILGPLSPDRSIPDGTIIAGLILHSISTFHIPIVHELYICRKILKLLNVALCEYNTNTSLFYKKFPNKKIHKIQLHFCMFVPQIGHPNRIKNVLKKINKCITEFIPEFININYYIFQTFGECEKYFWYSDTGVCFYENPKLCKMSKFKTITDIRYLLQRFNHIDEPELNLSETIFSDIF